MDVELEQLKKAYLGTRVITNREHDSVIKLLTIFAQHLAMISNQIIVQHENAEPVIEQHTTLDPSVTAGDRRRLAIAIRAVGRDPLSARATRTN